MALLQVPLKNNKYDIAIERGALEHCGLAAKAVLKRGAKVLIITDKNVGSLYEETVKNALALEGIETVTMVLEPGEGSKSFKTLQSIYSFAFENKLTRADAILALGGGVLGDVAGFAASTIFRGIDYLQVPTSLLAQVDSSVGGKVAINTEYGKNLVGAFYQPKHVLIDPNTIKTLAPYYFMDGMAEVIKYGCIKSSALFETLSNKYDQIDDLLENIIEQCCAIKAEVVLKDERDTGERMLLNFGHTVGHALERAYSKNGLSHGCGVFIGMCVMAKYGEELNITEKGTAKRIIECGKRYGLSDAYPIDDMNTITDAMNLDKKADSREISIVLLKDIGKSIILKVNKKEFIEDICELLY